MQTVCEAEGEGFEPSADRKARNGFRDHAVLSEAPANRDLFRAVGTAVGTGYSRSPTASRAWARRKAHDEESTVPTYIVWT